jgi:hypothetical protein
MSVIALDGAVVAGAGVGGGTHAAATTSTTLRHVSNNERWGILFT